MLRVILILAAVASAFAVPQTQNIQLAKGLSKSGPILHRAYYAVLESVTVLFINAATILKDLSVIPEGQNLALGTGVALLGELAVGRVGDTCAAADYINQYVEYVNGGGRGFGNSLISYIKSVNRNIDNIVVAVNNKQKARFLSGSRSQCPAEGREYQFEAAWDSILGAAKPSQLSLLQEEYCTTKRLYNSFTARNNNAAAHITASSLPATVQVFDKAGEAIYNLIYALATGVNPAASAAQAKQALFIAAQEVARN